MKRFLYVIFGCLLAGLMKTHSMQKSMKKPIKYAVLEDSLFMNNVTRESLYIPCNYAQEKNSVELIYFALSKHISSTGGLKKKELPNESNFSKKTIIKEIGVKNLTMKCIPLHVFVSSPLIPSHSNEGLVVTQDGTLIAVIDQYNGNGAKFDHLVRMWYGWDRTDDDFKEENSDQKYKLFLSVINFFKNHIFENTLELQVPKLSQKFKLIFDFEKLDLDKFKKINSDMINTILALNTK